MTTNIIKSEIIKNICYTELVYERINKKLGVNLSRNQIEKFVLKVLSETGREKVFKIGKNYYIENQQYNVRLTINSRTFRVITADKL